MLDDYASAVHSTAREKGFWPEGSASDIFIAKQCMMIVSEVTETMEAIRKDRGRDEIVLEVADILIRTLDLYEGLRRSGYVSKSLDEAFNDKTKFNETRPERHGVRF
jgi:NTP pyrophosphatase (non-canonical NTP hydrolase)